MRLVLATTLSLAFTVAAVAAPQQPAPATAPATGQTPSLAGDFVAALAGDGKAIPALVDRLHKGSKEDRAAFGQVLERLQPVGKELPTAGKAAPDPKAAQAPLPDAMRQLVADLAGSDAEKATAARDQLAAAAAKDDPEVRRLVDRAGNVLASCVLNWFRAQDQTGAIFAGQHAPLAYYGPSVLRLLQQWVDKPPPPRTSADAVRQVSIRALRDCVAGEPDPALLAQLRKTAADKVVSPAVAKEAGFALAQFGDRSIVESRIKELEAQAQAKNDVTRDLALADLADLYYNVRDYAKAADFHKQHIGMIEASEAVRRAQLQSLPAVYYNACCSMALAGQIDDAFAHLEKAIELGKQGEALRRSLLEVDMDIAALRADPRFAALLARFEGRDKK